MAHYFYHIKTDANAEVSPAIHNIQSTDGKCVSCIITSLPTHSVGGAVLFCSLESVVVCHL